MSQGKSGWGDEQLNAGDAGLERRSLYWLSVRSWGQATPRLICRIHENSWWWWRMSQKYLRKETELHVVRWGARSEPANLVVFTTTWLHRPMESRTSQLTMTIPRFLIARLGYLRLSGLLYSCPSFWTCSEFDSLRIWPGRFRCVEAPLPDPI